MRRLVADLPAVMDRLVIDSSFVRLLVRDISSVLIISGLLLLLDAGVMLIWQEPVTAAVQLLDIKDLHLIGWISFAPYSSLPLFR